eukprot:1185585-Prorocentrum_minimum.AAC.1
MRSLAELEHHETGATIRQNNRSWPCLEAKTLLCVYGSSCASNGKDAHNKHTRDLSPCLEAILFVLSIGMRLVSVDLYPLGKKLIRFRVQVAALFKRRIKVGSEIRPPLENSADFSKALSVRLTFDLR